ncbi:SDR family NAD(P)-dependent oxidoreductase [Actinomycetes bacterium M1A6_2h]
MSRVLITGSTDGIGRGAAASLLADGHDVIVHARTRQRLSAVADLTSRGALGVVGDLADAGQVQDVAEQANSIGDIDAVVHNAGVIDGPSLLPVNVVAPYLLTAAITGPQRLIYLSSSMHRSGRADLARADWSGSRTTLTYSDTKLLVTTLMAAVARLRPSVLANAVDPGWVPTKMGGPSASDDLELGHVTQAWLATTDDPRALVSGQFWHHQRVAEPHPAVHDEHLQNELLAALAHHTGTRLHQI